MHSAFFRAAFRSPRRAQELLRVALPSRLLRHLDLGSLRVLPGSGVDPRLLLRVMKHAGARSLQSLRPVLRELGRLGPQDERELFGLVVQYVLRARQGRLSRAILEALPLEKRSPLSHASEVGPGRPPAQPVVLEHLHADAL